MTTNSLTKFSADGSVAEWSRSIVLTGVTLISMRISGSYIYITTTYGRHLFRIPVDGSAIGSWAVDGDTLAISSLAVPTTQPVSGSVTAASGYSWYGDSPTVSDSSFSVFSDFAGADATIAIS